MYAFTPTAPVLSKHAVVARTSAFTPATTAARPASASTGPTMALRQSLRKNAGTAASRFGGVANIMTKADNYMAMSVQKQYIAMTQPSGVYTPHCTEGTTKGAAEFTRVRALNTAFRATQKAAGKKYFDMYEYRKAAIAADHICAVEEKQFCSMSKLAETYTISRAEAYGTCDRYATPETVEEAAMARYLDIQQKIKVNPSGVYNSSCNEGAAKEQAEDLRVATLGAAYRQGMKPANQILQEKYNQRKYGYTQTHGCSYEDELVTKYPAVGAGFRSMAYGY